MSEIDAPRADAAATPAPAPAEVPATFGRRLAAERERQGISVDDIASRLRLHPRQVRAIENEALPALPAPFLRGFVRNYAKELRLDPEPLVNELSARLGPQPNQVTRAELATSGSPRLPTPELGSRRVVVGGALAALIALAVLGWMATRGDRRADPTAPAPGKSVAPVAPAVAPSPPAGEAPKDAPNPATAPAVPDNTPPAQPAAPSSNAPGPGSAAPVAPAAVAVNVAATAAAAPFDGLRMAFREQAWVEVTQADGRVIHSQLNAAGSEQRIEGKVPLKLVVGNASTVSIEYKGKAIDLKPVTSPDNVARITLN